MKYLKTNKMKNILLVGVLFISVISFKCNAQNKATIKGKIKGYGDGLIFIQEDIPDLKKWYSDTIKVINDKFYYEKQIGDPRLTFFSVRQDETKPIKYYGFSVFLTKGKTIIKARMDKLNQPEIKNNKCHDEYLKMKTLSKEILKKHTHYRYAISDAYKNKDTEKINKFSKMRSKNLLKFAKLLKQQDNFKDSPVIAYFISKYLNRLSINELETYLNSLSSSMDNNIYIKSMKEELEREKKVQIGKIAFDFKGSDIFGKDYELSDYRGKYVLIDFSASWCGWCKKEIPYLKKVYEQHKNDKLVLFTINLDKKKADWIKDVKEFNLPWAVISDGKSFEGIAKKYNVHGIPEIMLIDPKGKIFKKGLRGNEMIKFLSKIFK